MASFDLVVRTGGSLHPQGGPSDFISEYTAFVRCHAKAGRVSRVGKLHAYRIHAGLAADHEASLRDVCHDHSRELAFVHRLLYEPDYSFKGAVLQQFYAAEPDTLVLDYVVLHPKWRGLKLGLLAVRKAIDLVGGGCGLAVSYIAPLDRKAHRLMKVPGDWVPLNAGEEERQEAAAKLRRYFKRMRFERVGRSPYYGLSLAKDIPTAEELLRPAT
jgi:hypothetical protein